MVLTVVVAAAAAAAAVAAVNIHSVWVFLFINMYSMRTVLIETRWRLVVRSFFGIKKRLGNYWVNIEPNRIEQKLSKLIKCFGLSDGIFASFFNVLEMWNWYEKFSGQIVSLIKCGRILKGNKNGYCRAANRVNNFAVKNWDFFFFWKLEADRFSARLFCFLWKVNRLWTLGSNDNRADLGDQLHSIFDYWKT